MGRKLRSNRGQALVEFALILPLVLLILFGIVEFGRVFSASLVISNAAREGARQAAVWKYDTDAALVSSVQDQCSPQLGTVTVTVAPALSIRVPGDEVTVTVQHSVPLVTPVLSNIAPNPFPLKAEATMRVE